ncbi:MAG: HEAT repeat domain-containing protein [Planctomycetota bacterium]
MALLGDDRAIPRLRELVQTSARRPQRLRDAAVALGALGDHEAAELLIAGLRDGRPTLAQVASIATGLGLIGDRRSVEPLLALAADSSAPDLARAFAVVALGQIVERSPLPWNTPLAVGTNYRAAVETLIDGVRGILDLH